MRAPFTAVLFLAFASLAPAQTTWFVDASATPPGTGSSAQPYTSIQFAIDQPTTLSGDTIVVRPGTYVENVDLAGKTLRLASETLHAAVIDGGAAGPVVSVVSGEGAGTELDGFVITNGAGVSRPPVWPDFGAPTTFGGSILLEGSTLRVKDCRVEQHTYGLYADGAVLDVEGSVFQSTFQRALVVTASTLSMTDSIVRQNGGFGLSAAGGLACVNGTSATLLRVEFRENVVDAYFALGPHYSPAWGGGMQASADCTVSIDDCDFVDNGALTSHGGGYYGPGTITNSRFVGNAAYDGGGVYGVGALTLTGCTIEENFGGYEEGGGRGGGVHSATLFGCTIARNVLEGDGWGGGAYNCTLQGCTVSENRVSGQEAFGGGLASCTATLCTIEGNLLDGFSFTNSPVAQGGGAFESDLVRCTVRNNVVRYGSDTDLSSGAIGGGGLHTGTATLCAFEGNRLETVARVGFVAGGGVSNATATGCLLRENSIAHFGPSPTSLESGGGAAQGSTLARSVVFGNTAPTGGATVDCSLDHCSVSGNVAGAGSAAVVDADARPESITSSIVWGNEPASVVHAGNLTVTYSDVEGGFPGTGNLSADPLFWLPLAGDLHLMAGSPAIDAGDPASPLDPDGSRADMGAYPFDGSYCAPPGNYCVAKTDSVGCAPAMGSTGSPTFTGADDFVLTASGVRSQSNGLMFYGTLPDALPFFGGTLCVDSATITRMDPSNSGGNPGGTDCSGSFAYPFTQARMVMSGLLPGDRVYAQAWYRDGGSAGLSDGLELVICP